MAAPPEILAVAFEQASLHTAAPLVSSPEIAENVEFVCRNIQNRAGVRLLMACLLAKTHRPEVDIRKPYTEIGTPDSFSGRTYDEVFLSSFITKHRLPCNPTTAFLTPALRNRNSTLTPETNLVGRPPKLYKTVLELLNDVQTGRVSSDTLLAEVIRSLVKVRDENQQRIDTLLAALRTSEGGFSLSAENIIRLIEQHLSLRGSSRLPVLVVAAVYQTAFRYLGERSLPLEAHNAADEQTGSLGDLEITLIDEEGVIAAYEMKTRKVSHDDIDRALQKIRQSGKPITHYVFITTEPIDEAVKNYAYSIYELTGGVEMVILDCLGFLRHFLHLFHRLRSSFLETYQQFLLAESESAVSQPLKEAFLALRHAAESAE